MCTRAGTIRTPTHALTSRRAIPPSRQRWSARYRRLWQRQEDQPMKQMHVGTASVNWGFDPLYDWTVTPSFDRLLNEMAACGYEGTEISYHFPMDVALLREELERRGLRAASTFHAVDLLDPASHDDEIARAMPAVYHPHVGTYVETRAEVDRLCALTDPALLGLCPDTGHLAYAGADPEAVFVDYAPRIWYVHLKDIDAARLQQVRAERLDFAAAVRLGLFVPLGEGMVDMERIFGALRASNYNGWVIVEQDAPADPLAAAMKSRAYLRERFGL